jgi:ATP phosphoribosyltransferase regulatory subunit
MPIDRAYIAGGRVGDARARLAALNDALMARFEAAGAERVDPAALQPAGALLDVYGEDLRGRAYTVEDGDGTERVMRPDFTVPVMQLHLASGGGPGRRAYLGPVWRRQPPGSSRPAEHLQAGVELIGEAGPEADATVFVLIQEALAEGGVEAPRVVTGDLGVVIALLHATPMPPARRAALRRHFWRPARFQSLLRRYAAPSAPPPSPSRAPLLADAGRVDDAIAAAGEFVGARRPAEIRARLAALAEDAVAAPVPADCAAAIEAALKVEGPAASAHAALSDIARGAGLDIAPALDRLAGRLDALDARGVDPATLPFRAATARTLEYYDGFVFEMAAPGRDNLPPLAGGGRYDGIAAALGAPTPIPAVGAMIRPEALLAAGTSEC